MVLKGELFFVDCNKLSNEFGQSMVELCVYFIGLSFHYHALGLCFYQVLILSNPCLKLMVLFYQRLQLVTL